MLFFTSLDIAEHYQLNMQDPATPIMEGIINFHSDLMFFLILIVIFILWILARCIYFFHKDRNNKVDNFVHGTTIEIIWTIIPAVLLFFIAIPSFALLYSMDEIIDPAFTIKVIGHQWYWSYEYLHFTAVEDYIITAKERLFDSYMIQEDDLSFGQHRLLEVDNRLVLPTDVHLKILITSSDVLHSWAIPSLGIKVDACPGRLNQIGVFLKREGVFYGQCSEICGINHGFMPIVIEALPLKDYTEWVNDLNI